MPTVTLTCRVTTEQHQRVAAWAQAAGHSVSDFVRAAVFEETHATASALEEAHRHGHRDAQAEAQQHIKALTAQLAEAQRGWAGWHRRAQEMENELVHVSGDLMRAVVMVLEGHDAARTIVAQQWACVPRDDRLRLIPSLAQWALLFIEVIAEPTSNSRFALKGARVRMQRAKWLMEAMRPEAGLLVQRQVPSGSAWHQAEAAVAAALASIEGQLRSAGFIPPVAPTAPNGGS